MIVLSMKSNRRLIEECSETGVFMLLDWQKVTGSNKEIEFDQDAVAVRRVACLLRAFTEEDDKTSQEQGTVRKTVGVSKFEGWDQKGPGKVSMGHH